MNLDFGKHIKDLLLKHDCVILPGLGGFVANYKPAEFDNIRNTVQPPSKHILFNPELVHNDGLLYAHVSRIENIGYKDVERLAETYFENIRKDSRKGMKFEIGELGYFHSGTEEKISFTADQGNNFLIESYGLPLLNLREVHARPLKESYHTIGGPADNAARQRRIRRWAYGTAAACLVTAMIFIPLKTNYFNQAGIDIPVVDSDRKEHKAVTQTGPAEMKDAIQGADLSPASRSFFPDPEYHIVVGSFKDFGNARQMRNQVIEKGYSARILAGDKGMFRVTAGTYTSKEETGTELAFVLSDYDQAWVLTN